MHHILIFLSQFIINCLDGAIPGHVLQGAVCICCKATQSHSWYEMPGAQLIGMMNCRLDHILKITVIHDLNDY